MRQRAKHPGFFARRWRALLAGGAVIGVVAGVMASAQAASAPINVMAIVPLSGPYFPYPQEAAANEIAFKYINAHGGINGHQVNLTTCDDQNDPNQAAACARQAVSGHDVAVVGSFTLYGENVMGVLTPNGITYLPTVPLSAHELSASNSYAFNLGGLLHLEAGLAAGSVAKLHQKESVALVLTPSTQEGLTRQFFQAGLRAAGFTGSVKLVPVQANATDYSPAVTQATQGTSTMYLELSQQQADVFLPALKQVGAKQTIVGTGGNSLAPQVIAANPQITNGALIADFYPPISDKLWSTYLSAFKTYATSSQKSLDMSLLGATGAWIDDQVFDQVVSKMKGAITAATVLKAFKTTKTVSTGGVTPPINLSKPFPAPALHAIYNTWGTIETVKNGKIVWNGKFVNTAPGYKKYVLK
jgi:ABC-type branched-subunit amino acid transport system substrate-binding protein